MDTTLDRLMQRARDGELSKAALADLLDFDARRTFLEACAAIEKGYTEECNAGEPCLPSGCSIDQPEGEVCLQPLLRAGADYYKACASAWIPLFNDPRNRSTWWRFSPVLEGPAKESRPETLEPRA